MSDSWPYLYNRNLCLILSLKGPCLEICGLLIDLTNVLIQPCTDCYYAKIDGPNGLSFRFFWKVCHVSYTPAWCIIGKNTNLELTCCITEEYEKALLIYILCHSAIVELGLDSPTNCVLLTSSSSRCPHLLNELEQAFVCILHYF